MVQPVNRDATSKSHSGRQGHGEISAGASPSRGGTERLAYIDGLRGVAILSVLLYHVYARWPALAPLPYGNRYAGLFCWGWLGVELFFMISGFVIFQTLDRCASYLEFLRRRWLRLFPGMLAATLVIFATAPLIERPLGPPSLSAAIAGLTFIDPRFLAQLGPPNQILEGTFWSLFVEVKFYILAGAVYFTMGRRWALVALPLTFAAFWISHELGLPDSWGFLFDVAYWGWFASGALFAEWKRSGSRPVLASALIAGVIASALPVPGAREILAWTPLAGLPFMLLFASALLFRRVQQMLSHRSLLFFGLISYPLYLIHEQAVVGLSVRFSRGVEPGWLAGLMPPLPIAIVAAVAWCIAKKTEPIKARSKSPVPSWGAVTARSRPVWKFHGAEGSQRHARRPCRAELEV